MSVLSFATFLLILLATLENACSGRPEVVNAAEAMSQDQDPSHRSNMINKKDGLKIKITDPQGTSRHQAVYSTARKFNIRVMATRHRWHNKHTSRKKNNHQGGGTKATFSVPQKNQEDQQHSSTLDYSPPKEHPPHHN